MNDEPLIEDGVKTRSDKPVAGRYYRSKDGMKVRVITTATHRTPVTTQDEFEARRNFVVFTHDDHESWCVTWPEWYQGEWREIFREEFVKPADGRMPITLSHKQGPWAIVYPYKVTPSNPGPREGGDIHVLKCEVYEGREGYTEGPNKTELVRVGGVWPYGDKTFPKKERGSPGRLLSPLDSRVYLFREDARRAKRLYMEANKIRPTSAAEVWGYEGYDDGRW